MADKILKWGYTAVLTVIMTFCVEITSVYAAGNTTDKNKQEQRMEEGAGETKQSKNEEKKKEKLTQAKEDRGYGPLNSRKLYLEVVYAMEDILEGEGLSRFGNNLRKMLGLYAGDLAKAQKQKAEKRQEEYDRKKALAEQMAKEAQAKTEAKTDIKEKRQKAVKKNPTWKKAVNWYRNSSKAQSVVGAIKSGDYTDAVIQAAEGAGDKVLDDYEQKQKEKDKDNGAAK